MITFERFVACVLDDFLAGHWSRDDAVTVIAQAADDLVPFAQAGEAGTAATTKIGAVHERAVREANAPRT